jgi:hypothetical protein
MQYYEIEEDSTSPTINKITESKAALANGLLGFQMNLVHSTAGISLDLGSPVTSSVSADDNILGPCDGGATPSGACRYRTTDSDQLPVHNVFGEGADDSTDNCCDFFLQIPFYCDGGAEGGGRYASSWGNPPLKLTCEDDLCKAYSGGNGYASGPGLSCEFLEKNTGPCEGEGCGKGGCASCAEYDPKNPYTLYYRLQTTNNEFIKTGTGMTPCPCTVYPCPFKIGVSSTMTTQQGVILWNNWVLGKDLKDSNFYGSRTFSGATPLNVNDPFNTKGITTEPIFDTDYDIQPPNCNSIDGTCTGNRCTQDPDSPKKATGWINGEWTFPLTTQSTSPTPNKQDTLNYMFARWGKNAMTNSLTLPSDPKPLVPIPTLPPNTYAGLALWLRDLVNSVQTTYSSDQGPGFIRDYMIAKTFASAYCSTLYGSVNVALLKDQNNVFPNQARVNWGYLNITDFIDVWQGSQLVGDSPTASFNKILMDRISDSFNETPGNDLPFLTQLRGITLLNNQQLDPFPVDGNDVYLQVPVDVFRMQQILKNTSSITTENFNDIIITPLLRGNTAINGIITPPGDKNPSKEPSPQFESNEDGSLKATYKYSGLTYVNPTTVFATTCKTKSGDYNSQIVTITDLSVIDKNSLWPLNTHATINSQNQVVSEDGGNGTPMIECLYYITVKIKKWSPALAFLYLATNEGRTVIPQQVYQKIYNDTTLVPNEYIGVLCSNPDGTNDMSKCKDMILQNCSTRYINDNFIFQPDDYFLLYNGRNSQGICACINSSLVPVSSKTVTGNIAAMCFDEQCATQYIPNSNPRINMNDLLGLSDGNCRTQCGALNDLLKGQASNIENLNTGKYHTLCGQTISTTFNTTFFVQLMIPTIIITALIPLGFGINKASIIVMVLTLLTLTGVSFYLGKLFAQLTECDTIGAGGKLPLCVSSMNPDMELPLSFCNINMFCECAVDGNCNTGCTCKSGVCVDKSGTRATETVYVKTINVQMLVLSSSLLILVPILIHLLRKRFFPKLSTFFEFCIIALSISIFGTVLYLSLVYEKPRLVYKGICGKKKNPGPAPGPTSVCDTQKFSPTILEQPGLPVGYFPCNTTVTLGDKPVTYKCPDGGVTCRELLKKTYPNATDNIGCLGRWNNANSDFCTIQYPDPNKGNLIPYTKKTGCNPDLENAVECSQ